MPNVIKPNVIVPDVFKYSGIMPVVIMPNVIWPNGIILTVAASLEVEPEPPQEVVGCNRPLLFLEDTFIFR